MLSFPSTFTRKNNFAKLGRLFVSNSLTVAGDEPFAPQNLAEGIPVRGLQVPKLFLSEVTHALENRPKFIH